MPYVVVALLSVLGFRLAQVSDNKPAPAPVAPVGSGISIYTMAVIAGMIGLALFLIKAVKGVFS